MKELENSTRGKYLGFAVIIAFVLMLIPPFCFMPLLESGLLVYVVSVVLFEVVMIFGAKVVLQSKYKKTPSKFLIKDDQVVLVYGKEKREKIRWDNIRDCTPKSPWSIRTYEGKDYSMKTIDDKIMQKVYNTWKSKKKD